MDSKKYFDEVTRKLSALDCDARQEKEALTVWHKGVRVGWVEHSGEALFNMAACQANNGELCSQISELAGYVREYVLAVEDAPMLQAEGLRQPYKQLANFGGAVLAGLACGEGGYQFRTWYWAADGKSVNTGEDCGDNFTLAKESFTRRSGLVAKERLFTDEQLVEMHRCISDTLDGDYELADGQRELLRKTRNQLEYAVPAFSEVLQISRDKQEQFISQQLKAEKNSQTMCSL